VAPSPSRGAVIVPWCREVSIAPPDNLWLMSDDQREQRKSDPPAAAPGLSIPPTAPSSPTPAGTPARPPFSTPFSPPAGPAPATVPSPPAAPSPTIAPAVPTPGPFEPAAPFGPPAQPATPAPYLPYRSSPPITAPAAPPPIADDADVETEEYLDEPEPTLGERLRRLRPAPVLLTLGSVGSLVFLILAVTSHTTPVDVLMSAAVVTGLIFGVDMVVSSVACWRASQDGETRQAVLLALAGGISALVFAGASAGTLVLILVLTS
jgi:hypothetical protein